MSPARWSPSSILASVRAIENMVGAPVHPLRFRANLYVEGWPAWHEIRPPLTGRSIGDMQAEGRETHRPLRRRQCRSGYAQRDLVIPQALQRRLGHADCGIYAEVIDRRHDRRRRYDRGGAAGNCCNLNVIGERSEAIHSFFLPRDGLLRFARNDGETAKVSRQPSCPRRRDIQYARLIDSITGASGILDRPLSRTMTGECAFAFSRRQLRPRFAEILSLKTRGSRECRVLAAPAVSCAKCAERCAHEHTGTAGALRHSLRNGLTAYAALSLETNSSCLHRCRLDG